MDEDPKLDGPGQRRKKGSGSSQRNLRFTESGHALLDAQSEAGTNVSAYVERLVMNAERDTANALARVMASHWTTAELSAVVDVCNGTFTDFTLGASDALAAEMEDGAVLHGLAAKWRCGDTWRERIKEVAGDEGLARALLHLAREFWAGNERVVAFIQRAGGK